MPLHAQQGEGIIRAAYRIITHTQAIEWNTTRAMKSFSESDTTIATGHVQYVRSPDSTYTVHVSAASPYIEHILVPDTAFYVWSADSTVYYILRKDWQDYPFEPSFSDDLAADVILNLKYDYIDGGTYENFYRFALDAYKDTNKTWSETFEETANEWKITLHKQMDTLRIHIRKVDTMITFGSFSTALEGEMQYTAYTFRDYQYSPHIPSIPKIVHAIPTYYRTRVQLPPDDTDTLAYGSPVHWSGTLFDGDSISDKDFVGDFVLYVFTYRACPWCQKAIPAIHALMDAFPELCVAGLDPYDRKDPENLRKYIKEKNIRYPYIFTSYETSQELKILGYPTLYLVNSNGILLFRHRGSPSDSGKKLIETLRIILGT